jgi:1-phosphatidylinositol-4-phosphate 5-kinase
MLHTLEMPSFLSDELGPTIALPYPASESLGEFRRSHEKTNGKSCTSAQKSIKSSFEKGLDHNIENARRAAPVVDGVMHDDNNGLSNVTNGRSSGTSWDKKSERNDSALSMNGGVNGLMENDGKLTMPQNGKAKVWIDSPFALTPNGGVVQPLHPIEPSIKVDANGENNEPPKRMAPLLALLTKPESTGPLRYNSSLLPATPTPETPKRNTTTSTHRFSSPPAYPPTNSAVPSNSAISSQQHSHPQLPPLQHRHTLQVPKPGLNRGSKDGDDGAFASGRFSPTTATGSGRRNSLNLYRRNTRSLHSDVPHEEIPQDEDAMRWAEAIRQKRASKRRRKDEEDEDRVVVGTKVDQNHVNWVTAYNMLTGIRFTVSRTNAKLDRPLTDQDFEQKHKFSFDM